MKRIAKIIVTFMTAVTLCATLPVSAVSAVITTCESYNGTNIENQNYNRWSNVIDSYLEFTDDGKLMKVQNTQNDGVTVEYYDTSYNYISGKKIAEELPIFGGFYASKDYYFLVTGQTNSEASADVEGYRITKYDKNWKRIASTGLYDCNTAIPFDAGSCRMDMLNNYLMIRTCHEMYNGHQANVTIQVDTTTMTITDSYTIVMNSAYGYVSHSFNQFIKMEGNNIVAVDHGDAHPRSIALLKYPTDASTGKFVPNYYNQCQVIDVMSIPGATGQNTTNATVGGFEISDTSYLVAGNSVVQDDSNLTRITRNVYVASVNKSTNAVKTNWITNYSEGETTTRTPQLVKVSDDRYILFWSRVDTVYYVQIDGEGNKVGNIYSIDGHLSDCVPTIVNNKVVWYTWNDGQIIFYEISLNNLSKTNKTEVNNGHDYINNGVVDGVANLTCQTCGKVTEMNVSTSMSVYWREESGAYGSYSSSFPSVKDVGDIMYCLIRYSPTDANSDIRIVIDNPDIVSVERIDDSNDIMYELRMKQAGTTTVTVLHKYNPKLKRTYKLTVNTKASLEINGFQISATNKGFRTVYSVSDPVNEVVSAGLVYGLSDYATADDMVVGSSNESVHNFKATSLGKMSSTFSELESATSYAMTMKFGDVSTRFYEAPTMVRAYAELSDGTYIYSDVKTYTIYNVANIVYTNNWMNNEAAHNYLYTDILSKVNGNYKTVEFVAGDSLVTP